ncbi:MAG: glycosyl hydrolase family 65 protein [Cyanobacteria bacterium J06597_16]
MLHREPINLPEHIYPTHPWQLEEKQFYPRFLGQQETLYALGNGYLGIRGCFEEGTPAYHSGTFVNGFHELWPIIYPEEAYGFAKTGQTMLNVPDSTIIKLYVDDEPFTLPTANLLSYRRVLNMQAGTLERNVLWETPTGKKIAIKSCRLVSFEYRHLAAISYEVTVVDGEANIDIVSKIHYDPGDQNGKSPTPYNDPRRSREFASRVLLPQSCDVFGYRLVLAQKTRASKMTLACGVDHTLVTDCPYTNSKQCGEDTGEIVFSLQAQAGMPIQLTKYMTYHTGNNTLATELRARAERTLDRATKNGFERLQVSQRQYLDDFWLRSDVQLEGNPDLDNRVEALQQAIRFSLFHILQAASRTDGLGLPAKGLTGKGYEGHYFWDTEIYVLPFLSYTQPQLAKNLLKFRYSLLDKARQRAQMVSQKGALFPWRTINGEEASAYYAAGTAQYHINADIVFGLKKYVEVTGDTDFLYGEGAEILIETARLWYDLGFFSERCEGKFCIHSVTGPDEYNTVVNDNLYTNLMARANLHYAVSTLAYIQEKQCDRFEALVHETALDVTEMTAWKNAADHMYLPYDEKLKIHLQHDGFLDEKVWDFENTPSYKYPLLLHFHPLFIYRHQVVKQADLVLAMFLLGDEFSLSQKKRNFEYYDALTTGDSSLSVCIQSIMASEIGDVDKAFTYATYAIIMDLGNLSGNVKDGCHIASMGGSWMAMVYGFGGLRDYNGKISFSPRLPVELNRLAFSVTVRQQLLKVELLRNKATYCLQAGTALVITHEDKEISLTPGIPVAIEMS